MRLAALTRTTATALAAALLMPVASHAQRRPSAPDPGDKSRGEEEQIEKREEWFRRSRSLDSVSRPDLLRSAAALDLARRQAQRGEELRAAGQSWQPLGPMSMTMFNWAMGPVAGRSIALAVHPTNDSILYLGTASGGLWKTTDGGGNWTSIFDSVGTLSVGSVALQASDPSVVWAGTGERQSSCTAQGGGQTYFGQGIFRSTDAGATFQARNGVAPLTLDLSYVNSIAIHPTSPDTLVVAGEAFCLPDGTRVGGGVFKTTDGGGTWARVKSGTGSDVFYDPTDSSVMYLAVSGEGIFKSTNGGDTWSLSLSNFATRIRLAIAPTDAQSLYALTSSSQLFRTTTGGVAWTQVNSSACEGQCTYDLVLDVHPGDANSVLIGTVRFWQSFNGGTTLTPVTATWGSAQAVHQDTHIVKFSRNQPGRYWVGGDGGLWRTDTSGFDFVNLNSNLNLTQFYDVAIHPTDPSKVWGGAQDNSSSRRNASLMWDTTEVTGDGFMNLVDADDPSIVFQTSYPLTSPSRPAVYRSLTGGAPNTFARLPTNGIAASGEAFPWVTPLALIARTAFVGSTYLYRGSTTQPHSSFTWTKISKDLTQAGGGNIVVITPFPARGRLEPREATYDAYVGTSNGRIWRARDVVGRAYPAPMWTNVTSNYPGGYVSDIAVDPKDSDRVYVTRGAFNLSRLYRSTNGGASWDGTAAGLPNVPANAVAVDPTDGRRVFVGTDVGVYESIDYGATFQPFSLDLPLGVVVTDLEIDDSPYALVAATYGRGAWRVDLIHVPASPPSAEFAATPAGLTVAFGDRSSDSDGAVVSWLWSFGDGTVSRARNPVKAYSAPGAYSVTLTVTDDRGASSSRSTEVVVSGASRARRRR